METTSSGEFSMDRDSMMVLVESVVNAPKGTYAYEVRNDWIELAMSMNADRLYESTE